MRKILGLLIIILIFGFTGYLISQIPQKERQVETIKGEDAIPKDVTEEWMGIFIKGQRVGYSFTKIARFDYGLEVENKTRMQIFMMNAVTELNTHFYAHTDTSYALNDFSMEIITAGHPIKLEGRVKGNELTLTIHSQGTTQTQKKTLKEKPFFPDALEQVIKNKNLKPGDEITIPYFDPTTQSSAPARIKVFPPEKIVVLNKETVGTKVVVNFLNMVSYLWLDNEYRVLKEATPNLEMEMIPLTKEEALVEIKPSEAFDLLSFFSIKLKNPLPINQEISYIKLELKDIDIEGLDLEDDYQKLVSKEPIIIESSLPVIEEIPRIKIPVEGQREFLQPSIYIQSDHPDIIAEAKKIVGNEKDAFKAAERLVNGVYKMIKKNPTPSLPSALDVLKSKEGDCNEHSVLFTALARAIGIPAKIYVGLVNLNGDAYFYHAWCAIWLGKWIPVDPTFNQFPADLYHLKLKEGEISDWAQVMKVVGRLKIEVLEYK